LPYSNHLNLLKSRRFLPLFVTQFFGAFNDNAFKSALLIWLAYDFKTSHADMAMMVSLAAGLFVLPFFLFSALAGQIADKYDKSHLARLIKLAEIILMFIAWAGFYWQNAPLLLLLLFLLGSHSAFFGPIKYSLLPEHLQDDELVSGNGLIESGTFLAILLGTIFGGLVIRKSYGVEILAMALIAAAAIGWIASRFIPKSHHDYHLKIDWNLIAETKKIINYARKDSIVWLAIIGISWFWLIGAVFLTQLPIYIKQVIHGDEHIVTLFLVIFSLGIAIGSLLCNKLLKGQIIVKPFAVVGVSAAIIIFYLASQFYSQLMPIGNIVTLEQFLGNFLSWPIIISLLMLAIFSGIYAVPLYALMQHYADKKYLSRIIAASNVLSALFMVLASIVTTLLFLFLKISEIFLICGIVNIVLLAVIRKISRQI
jgi:acyl-[acyl-carrier-protein]-phospholipid O-acyltransferase/long-chain-fatty-acid--[acyl-carrier-protein] ligase